MVVGSDQSYNERVLRRALSLPRWLVAALVVLFLTLPVVHGSGDRRFLAAMWAGAVESTAGCYTRALRQYDVAAALGPRNPVPHLEMAKVYLAWGREERALAVVEDAVALGAGLSAAEAIRIEAYERMELWAEVEIHAKWLLGLLPDNLSAHRALADAYLQVGSWNLARHEFERILRLSPTDDEAARRLDVLLLGEDPGAVDRIESASTVEADRLAESWRSAVRSHGVGFGHVMVCRELLVQEMWALAARHCEVGLQYLPDLPDAHGQMGLALMQLGRMEEAWVHLRQSVQLAPDSPQAHQSLGLYYRRRSEAHQARLAFEKAYDLDPGNPAVSLQIAQSWEMEGQYLAAEVWLRHAVALRPEDAEMWEALATFYVEHGTESGLEGVTATQVLLELAPFAPSAHYLRARAALQVGDLDTARRCLKRAVELDPALAEAYLQLGWLWAELGEDEAAAEAFLSAVNADRDGIVTKSVKSTLDALLLTR